MGCSSSRQCPAPALHPDPDHVGKGLRQDSSDHQNQGSGEEGRGDGEEGGDGGSGSRGGAEGAGSSEEEGSRGEGEDDDGAGDDGGGDGALPSAAATDKKGDRSPGPPPKVALPTLERLAQATGGTEKSWYRCVFPFGVISLVIGMAGTGVTFTFDTLLQTKVVSVALLCVGVAMLLTAAACWRAHRLRRRKKKEGGFFCSEQGTL